VIVPVSFRIKFNNRWHHHNFTSGWRAKSKCGTFWALISVSGEVTPQNKQEYQRFTLRDNRLRVGSMPHAGKVKLTGRLLIWRLSGKPYDVPFHISGDRGMVPKTEIHAPTTRRGGRGLCTSLETVGMRGYVQSNTARKVPMAG